MKQLWKGLVSLALALSVSGTAFALTAQDKADKNITDDGQSRTVQTGTILQEAVSDTDLQSGDQVTCGTVPTDKNWYITRVGYQYTGTTTNVRIALLADGKTADQDGAPTTNEAQSFTAGVWLDEGETLKLEPKGYTAGDDLYCWTFGIEYPDAGG